MDCVLVDLLELFEHQLEMVADANIHPFSGFEANASKAEFDAQHIVGGIQGWKGDCIPVTASIIVASVNEMRQTQKAGGVLGI